MTSDSIIKKERDDAEKKRVKQLIDSIERLYPCKNKIHYIDNDRTDYAKMLRQK